MVQQDTSKGWRRGGEGEEKGRRRGGEGGEKGQMQMIINHGG